jgi:DNA-binding IclR family transcriptional regulator
VAKKALDIIVTKMPAVKARTQRMPKPKQVAASKKADRQFVTALGRGLKVLQCFTPAMPELGTSQIARLTGLPQPTVWRLCHTLTQLGFLIPVADSDRLRLGLPVLTLGYTVLANNRIGETAKPYMQAIAKRYQGAVSLGVRDGLNMLYLQRCQGSLIILADLGIGSRVPLAYSATGWAHLAAVPDGARKQLISEIRAADRQKWATTEPLFEASLAKFRKTGYIVNIGSLHPQVNAVAVPVHSQDGSVLLTVSSGGINSVFTDEVLLDVGSELKALAERLGRAVTRNTSL